MFTGPVLEENAKAADRVADPPLDEAKYEALKPLLREALEVFQRTGKSLDELIDYYLANPAPPRTTSRVRFGK